MNYWGRPFGLGPIMNNIRWLAVPDGLSRKALLQTGEVQIAQTTAKDIPALINQGFEAQKGALFNTMRGISFTGNYWERFGALTGAELQRNRDISKPWVGSPFENGADYDDNTPSMQNARLVRNAFAWAIEREGLVEDLLGGLGFVNHQPYLSASNPNYRNEWSWGTDFTQAQEMMTEAGFPDGFEMDLWVGTGIQSAEIGEYVGAAWFENLGVKVNLIKTAHSTFRPGLVARTTNTPGVNLCGDENKSNFPYDWAHGFVVSSMSAGGYGVGQEVPYATESYFMMAGEPDGAKRELLAANFYTQNRFWANCVGLFEEPQWPVFNPNEIAEWDQRPNANGNLYGINNVRSIRLK